MSFAVKIKSGEAFLVHTSTSDWHHLSLFRKANESERHLHCSLLKHAHCKTKQVRAKEFISV
jgi:hypothetical protein